MITFLNKAIKLLKKSFKTTFSYFMLKSTTSFSVVIKLIRCLHKMNIFVDPLCVGFLRQIIASNNIIANFFTFYEQNLLMFLI